MRPQTNLCPNETRQLYPESQHNIKIRTVRTGTILKGSLRNSKQPHEYWEVPLNEKKLDVGKKNILPSNYGKDLILFRDQKF